MAVIYSHYVNPVEVGRACANRLMEAEHQKKIEQEQEQRTQQRIDDYEADSETNLLFNRLMRELGLSCEFIPGHGMKLMNYGPSQEETREKLLSALESFKQSQAIFSIYDDAELTKMERWDSMLVSEIKAWRKAFPGVIQVHKCKMTSDI